MISETLENLAQIDYNPENKIVYITYKKSELNGDDAFKVVQTVIDITGNDEFAIFADHRNVLHLTTEAKNILIQTHPRLLATAILVNSALTIFWNMYIKIFFPKYVFKIFTDFKEAEEWLLQKIKENTFESYNIATKKQE